MLPERLDQRLNDQLNHEFEASQAYIAMGAYFSIRGFYGFADFYLVQAEKKRSRAMKFYHYLVSADGNLLISKIDEPYCDFQSSLEVIQYSLEHEKVITDNIYSLILLAVELKAYPTLSFLQCFVDEKKIGSCFYPVPLSDADFPFVRQHTPSTPAAVCPVSALIVFRVQT